MGVLWHKVWYDLWAQKARTLQVILIIAAGAFAVGMIVTTRNLILVRMQDSWQASSPPMIILQTTPAVDDATLNALKKIPGVVNVEGFAAMSIEWRRTPDDEWRPAELIARNDYQDQSYARLALASGQWPHKKRVAVVQGADTVFNIRPGQQVFVRINHDEDRAAVGGVLYDPNVLPPGFGGNVQFYTTRQHFYELTGEPNFNRMMASAATFQEEQVTDLADQIQRKLEKQNVDSRGASVLSERIYNPEKHFFQDIMDGIFFVLELMAILAMILGSFLVYNTINAIIARQIDQIGTLKAIGATTRQILLIYLATIGIYSLFALILALPLGTIGGWYLNVFLLNTFNVEPGPFTISPPAIVAQFIVTLLFPLLAALAPVFSGARVTVHEAIYTYGLSSDVRLLDRLLAKIHAVPRLILLTTSNAFRRRRRVVLTQITLVLSGLIFMMVMSARDSLVYTFNDVLFSILDFNISLLFEHPERIDRVEQMTAVRPEVKAVEMWQVNGATIRPLGQPPSRDDVRAVLFGVPLPTALYHPQMEAGRWLQPGDTHALVLNQKMAADIGVGVGDGVVFDQGVLGETSWQVVGLLFDPIITTSAHVPRDVLLRDIKQAQKANTVWIQTVRSDAASEAAGAKQIRQFYAQQQLDIAPKGLFENDTSSQIVNALFDQVGVIITLLAVMAIVIGVVGSIALSGILSLNALERWREIGVMRAIGASSLEVVGLFVGEGLILGWLSWLIALPFSIPAGRLMTQILATVINGKLLYHYTFRGALYWLGIVTLLSILASWWPARGALRISVRESLAYQ